jgi:hypothetical protein
MYNFDEIGFLMEIIYPGIMVISFKRRGRAKLA